LLDAAERRPFLALGGEGARQSPKGSTSTRPPSYRPLVRFQIDTVHSSAVLATAFT